MSVKNLSFTPDTVKIDKVMDAVVGDTTSAVVDIFGAKAVAIIFTTGSTTFVNRSGVLTVKVGTDGDGTLLGPYNMLIDNVTNSNSETLTRVAGKTLATEDAIEVLWFDPATLGAIPYLQVDLAVTDTTTPAGDFTVEIAILR